MGRKKFDTGDLKEIEVLVIGDEAVRLGCLLTSVEQRNTCAVNIGFVRTIQTFVSDEYFVNVAFVAAEETLLDPFVVNATTDPFRLLVLAYTHGDEASLRRVREYAKRLIDRGQAAPAKRKPPRVTALDGTEIELPLAPFPNPVGNALLVAVNPTPYTAETQDSFPDLPKTVSASVHERDCRVETEAYEMMQQYGNEHCADAVAYLGEEDLDCAPRIFRWILEEHNRVAKEKEKIAEEDVSAMLQSLLPNDEDSGANTLSLIGAIRAKLRL